MRSEAEVRAELERFKVRQIECRHSKSTMIEAAYAAIIIGALSFVLGEAPSAAVRIKVE